MPTVRAATHLRGWRISGIPHSPAAENIGAGHATAEAVLKQWQTACDPDSSGSCTYAHRKNMLNPSYKVIGIGRAHNRASKFGWYWTTDFGGVVDQLLNPKETSGVEVRMTSLPVGVAPLRSVQSFTRTPISSRCAFRSDGSSYTRYAPARSSSSCP